MSSTSQLEADREEVKQLKAELLSFYRMAESGVWVKTEEYSKLIAHAHSAKSRDAEVERLRGALKKVPCDCKYKPFTHQYVFTCARCEALREGDL